LRRLAAIQRAVYLDVPIRIDAHLYTHRPDDLLSSREYVSPLILWQCPQLLRRLVNVDQPFAQCRQELFNVVQSGLYLLGVVSQFFQPFDL